jgi:hypothetical protein
VTPATCGDQSGSKRPDLIVNNVEAFPPNERSGSPAELDNLEPAGTGSTTNGADRGAGVPWPSDAGSKEMHLVALGKQGIYQLPCTPLTSTLPVEIQGHHGNLEPVHHLSAFSAPRNR